MSNSHDFPVNTFKLETYQPCMCALRPVMLQQNFEGSSLLQRLASSVTRMWLCDSDKRINRKQYAEHLIAVIFPIRFKHVVSKSSGSSTDLKALIRLKSSRRLVGNILRQYRAEMASWWRDLTDRKKSTFKRSRPMKT